MLRFLLTPLAILSLFTTDLMASARNTQWHVLESGAVTTTPELIALFPDKFTADDIKAFNGSANQTQKGDKTYTVDEDYTQKIQAYRLQVLTARDAQRAEQITFTGLIDVIDGHLVGTYQYKSPYGERHNASFKVTLTSDKIKALNVFEPLLGEDDFFERNVPPITSLFNILSSDDAFIRQTPMATRLNVLMGNLLLILSELNHQDIHDLSEDARKAKGKELITSYFSENEHQLYTTDKHNTNDPAKGTLENIGDYIGLNKKLRTEVLSHFDIDLNTAPSISKDLAEQVFAGKVFYIGIEG